MGELIVIAIVALLFLGPEKLPDAAKSISKGIRDFRKQTRELQQIVEDDHEIGGAIRDLKSALRGEEPPSAAEERRRRAAEATRKAAENAAQAAEELSAADGPKTLRASAGQAKLPEPDAGAPEVAALAESSALAETAAPTDAAATSAVADAGAELTPPDLSFLRPAAGAVPTNPRSSFNREAATASESDAGEGDADRASEGSEPPEKAHG